MPNINNILKGLKVSVLTSLLLCLVTISGYFMSIAIYYIRSGIVDIGTRIIFVALFCVIMTVVVGLQTREAIQATLEEDKVLDIWDVLSLQTITLGGIGVVVVTGSIYDLLTLNINRAIVESPIGVLTIVVAVLYWLAKSPASDQITFKNGPTAMIIFYIVFLAALVPVSGVAIYWFYPVVAKSWIFWSTFWLPMIAGLICFLRLMFPKKILRLR